MSTDQARQRNIFEGSSLERAGHHCKDEDWVANQLAAPQARVIPVWRTNNLVSQPQEDSAEGGAEIPIMPISLDVAAARQIAGADAPMILLGLMKDAPIFATDISHLEAPLDDLGLAERGSFSDLRELAAVLDRGDAAVLAYARALTHWHRHNRFCGNCGSPSTSIEAGHARLCSNPDCATTHFPRTDPAVIMLVTQGDNCLLARRSGRMPATYSTLAGFVEPGESLEEAVAREVMEEVGLTVHNMRYQSSQPWPFPAQLMLGFHAEAIDRECRFLDAEIEDARWFTRDEVQTLLQGDPRGANAPIHLPRSISIARRLIRDWANQD